MAKKKTKKTTEKKTKLSANQVEMLDQAKRSVLRNTFGGNATTTLSRSALDSLLNPEERDINFECGYPDVITRGNYRDRYNRDGIATRVVDVYPDESWAVTPEVFEDKQEEPTEFEKAWKELEREKRIWQYCERADKLSGIGSYGILLLGIDDNKPLDQPVEGIDERTGVASGNANHQLLYLKPFDISAVTIKKQEEDVTSPRFGLPIMYSIHVASTGQETDASEDTSVSRGITKGTVEIDKGIEVHWTRVIHLADNRLVSEVHGVPRMRDVYDRLWDIRKIASGSGEMYWKGAFPGYAFSVNQEMSDVTLDDEALKDEFRQWSEGLQRWLILQGMDVTSLAPQVSDPGPHLDAELKYIAIAKGIPLRVFTGTEEAKLAGAQDERIWNKRIAKRQNRYLTPMVIRPLIDRLIDYGALPEPKSGEYFVEWPDLTTPSDSDRALNIEKFTTAMAKYVTGNVDAIVAPAEFLRIFFGLSEEDIEAIMKGAKDRIEEIEVPEEEDETSDSDSENDDDEGNSADSE